ncbi:GRB10-interacting GYF protein 2-like [Dendronephthya gigantea]|uniref:GRB10-interacting GYF protein 2-like n=1 Tax=Dendronephthya gigantea TaxID=151771 RepID=UPI00106BC3A3|nr:GRB10-interacting GYF protein 2-like [Dendronephthya gigantea]
MSEQSSEALNFGPQWIRDLSNGASVSVPPPSAGPGCKLAQFRYGKEEMLALFSKDLKPPKISKEVADFILKTDACNPLALMPLTEEEQRNSFGSLNSLAVLKMMGRGGQRGGRGMSRGGRGSGRGRGEQGYYRSFSQDESSSTKTEDGWQREGLSRKQSWGESAGRGGFGDRANIGRDSETSPRGYEPTAPPGRHSRALASGNWRSSEGDDEQGGWVTPRGSERWRTSPRDNWHKDEHTRERRFSDRDRTSFEDIPEWSKPDNVFEPDSGSFDASGAFCVTKDKRPPDDSGGGSKEDWDLEIADENDRPESIVATTDQETSHQNQQHKDPEVNAKHLEQQENAKKTAETPTEDNPQSGIDEKGIASEPSLEISPSEEQNLHASSTVRHDEVGADLERVAESCIANLVVEHEELPAEEKLCGSTSEKQERTCETQWFYRDPQGLEQGPFSNDEMVEWFNHGYFTMQLSVRRQCDAAYLPLGDLIKRWKRVPFVPGPSPPPLTHQQVINEQQMQQRFMQQQLLQQHYQHLQKQAILQQIQQQHQLQHEQRQQTAESTLQLNFPAENQPSRTTISPRTLPTTSHSGSPVGAAEIIWGAEPQSPKDTWSQSGNASWNEPQRETSPAPNEERRRRERNEEFEREKARERLEAEKKEAEMLRQKEDEERRQLAKKQEEEKLRQQIIEEEQRQQELQKAEAERRKREEAEKRLKALKEEQLLAESQKKKGKERQEKRREDEAEEISKEASKRNGENEKRKKKSERRKHEETVKKNKGVAQDVKDEETRHEPQDSQKQLEAEWDEQEDKSRYKKEINQDRNVNGSSRSWGAHNTAAMSLFEIQQQEEKNRKAHEEKMKELEAKQRQLQSEASLGWSSEKLQPSSNVKSLKAIQDEQARQAPKKNKQASRSQPPQASSAWATTAGNNNVWTGNHNEREKEQEPGFWNEVMSVGKQSTGKSQAQTVKNDVAKQVKQSATKPVTNGKKSSKKSSKEEESVRKIFQQQPTNSDPFTEWCNESLRGIATGVDIPTFIAFLQDLESPYEVHTYVREYIGDNNEAKSFAKEFIERRRSSEWKHVPTKSTSAKQPTSSAVVARGAAGGSRNEPESNSGKAKKKKKQRMQKVDPSILGFSVNAAAERVNMGEIQSLDDS